MAIEFNCPNCAAMIRVPDNAGGGKGKCPRCTKRITVPKKSTKAVPKPPPEPSPELDGLFAAPEPEVTAHVPSDPSAVVFEEAEPEFDPAAPVDFTEAPAHKLGELPVVDPVRAQIRPGSLASKLKAKNSGVNWAVPAIFVVILCGIGGWFGWQQFQAEHLSGELTAESAPRLDLPYLEIPGSTFRQSPDEIKKVLERLEASPVKIPSMLMQILISANKHSMTVKVNVGQQTSFYRVDTNGDAPLAKYRKAHSKELEQLRTSEIEQSASEFVDEYQKVKEKKVTANTLNEYRNSLALPTLVRGLGHQVVAVHGPTMYYCVYEDNDGGLYFLLPPGLQSFEITGRKSKDGKVIFPGTYVVKVTGEMKMPEKSEEPEPADKKKGKKVERMNIDDDKKSEMNESMDDGEMKKPKSKD